MFFLVLNLLLVKYFPLNTQSFLVYITIIFYNNKSKMHKQFQIQDRRTEQYFKKTTFCGYKKTKVVDALKKNILLGNIEKASLWATELHISGHTRQLFDIILDI